MTMTDRPRLLPLEGGHNFRDLGGYRTEDGRTVRWDRLFRSGVMSHLTDEDYDFLRTKGIRTICDFRSNGEREREPTVWRASDEVTYRTWDYQNAVGDLAEVVRNDMTAARMRQVMVKLYEALAYQHAEKFRALFDHLAEGAVPLVFNCSAGKDRTGVAAALVLTALGVPREAVIEDYALTERVVDYDKYQERTRKASRDGKPQWSFLSRYPAEVLEPMLRSDPDYLQVFFTTVESRHGSVLGFIEAELGVDDTRIARMRDHLLE